MKILALDISLSTGFSLPGKSGTINLRDEHAQVQDFARTGLIYMAKLRELVRAWRPDLIVIEKPFIRGATADFILLSMVALSHMVAYENGIPRRETHNATIKKWLTGKGNCGKGAMVEALNERGYTSMSNDEADAIALRLYWEEQIKSEAA